MRVLDLFSGMGGFSLGLERAGFETVAFCEIEPYCRKVLNKHWPDTPIHEDIRELDGTQYRGAIDVVCGGWPCQTYSSAARGRNVHPDMYPDFLRIVGEAKPRWVIAENVALVNVDTVYAGLEELGYTVRAHRFQLPFGNHLRDRIFFMANSHGNSESRRAIHEEMAVLSEDARLCGQAGARFVGVDDGIPHRMDRLRALGNAVVPQISEILGRAIMEASRI